VWPRLATIVPRRTRFMERTELREEDIAAGRCDLAKALRWQRRATSSTWNHEPHTRAERRVAAHLSSRSRQENRRASRVASGVTDHLAPACTAPRLRTMLNSCQPNPPSRCSHHGRPSRFGCRQDCSPAPQRFPRDSGWRSAFTQAGSTRPPPGGPRRVVTLRCRAYRPTRCRSGSAGAMKGYP
jgi:hypothetical protein